MRNLLEILSVAVENRSEVLIEFNAPLFNYLNYVVIEEMEQKENGLIIRTTNGSEIELNGISSAEYVEEDDSWKISEEDCSYVISVIGD